MRTISYFISWFIAVVILFGHSSCEKENNTEVYPMSKFKVKKITNTYYDQDPFLGVIVDTIVCNFGYDNIGLLVYRDLDYRYSEKYYYNSSEKLEKKDYFYFGDLSGSYSYLWEGKTISKFLNDYTHLKILFHLNETGEIMSMGGYYFYDNNWVKTYYYSYLWENGNLIKKEAYAIPEYFSLLKGSILDQPVNERELDILIAENLSHIVDQEYEKLWDIIYSYDDKINPLRGIQSAQLETPEEYSKNNILSFVKTNYTYPYRIDTITYNYYYNQNNCPIKREREYYYMKYSDIYEYVE